jgi:phytanoyl-CoA hydroxylase
MLTPHMMATRHEDGFLVLPGFKPADERATACRRAHEIVAAFEPGAHSSRFSTRDRRKLADAELLASAEAVHCFFEEEALDDDDRLRMPKERRFDKIDPALHDIDPVFNAFSHGPALAALAAGLGLVQPQVWQSQLIFKQPHIGGEVGWHPDARLFVTTRQTVTTFWFALEDANLDNGCQWVLSGGHRGPGSVLRAQFVCERPADGSPPRLVMRALDGTAAHAAENWLQRSAALPLHGLD